MALVSYPMVKVKCRSKSEVLLFYLFFFAFFPASDAVLRSRLVRHRHRSRAKLSSSHVFFFFFLAFPFFCVLSVNLYLFSRTCNSFFFFPRRIFLKIVLSSGLLSGRLLLSPSAFHCIFPSLSLSLSLSWCGCLCLFSFSVSVFLVVLVTIVRVFSNISSSGLWFSEISSSACVEFGVKASFS